MPRKVKVLTRADKTMSESEFWSFIRSSLRRRSMFWKPMSIAKNKARRPYTGGDARTKWEYQCAICNDWFKGKDTHIDHIIPVGSLTDGEHLKEFVENLFCDSENLRVLCKPCHKIITKEQKQK